MEKFFLPVLIVFGISLFSYDSSYYATYIPFTISVPDIVVILMLFYAFFKVRTALVVPISSLVSFLAGVLLISGIYNYLSFPLFDLQNFSLNYIRVIAIVAMVYFFPPLFNKIGGDNIANTTVWIIRLHCLVLFIDAFGFLPVQLEPGLGVSTRPTGFFYEPGWFGVWIGLAVLYVIQAEKNYDNSYFNFFDIIFISFAIILSTGVRGAIFLAIIWFVLFFRIGLKARLRLIGAFLIMAMFVALGGERFLPIVPDNDKPNLTAIQYFKDRISVLIPGNNFRDGSVMDRVESTSTATFYTLKDAPLLGIGLGGNNWENRLPIYHDITNIGGNIAGKSGTSMMILGSFVAGGILGLIFFSLIGLKLFFNSSTRIIGLGLGVAAFIWGGTFETFIWYFVTLAITFLGYPGKMKYNFKSKKTIKN